MVNENTIRAVNDAIESAPKRKFTESVDLVVNLKNIDLSQPKNRITESIVLPKGRGKSTKIGVFAKGDLAIKSQSGGADLIISPEDIDKMSGDKKLIRTTTRDIDFFVADNIEALLNTIESKLENGSQNIASVYIKTTMGPAVRLM